jgi:hypothetical protein
MEVAAEAMAAAGAGATVGETAGEAAGEAAGQTHIADAVAGTCKSPSPATSRPFPMASNVGASATVGAGAGADDLLARRFLCRR